MVLVRSNVVCMSNTRKFESIQKGGKEAYEDGKMNPHHQSPSTSGSSLRRLRGRLLPRPPLKPIHKLHILITTRDPSFDSTFKNGALHARRHLAGLRGRLVVDIICKPPRGTRSPTTARPTVEDHQRHARRRSECVQSRYTVVKGLSWEVER